MTSPISRTAYIDHLRIALTILVIFHHTAIVYGGAGGWYWRQEPEASARALVFFNAVNQSFFMGFFFLLAGYFTPASYDKKGPRRFLMERFLRLGLPLAIYFFLISTLTIALARTADGHALWKGWGDMIRARVFEPGPLWFAEALLLFALLYVTLRKLNTASSSERGFKSWPSTRSLAWAALLTGAVSFAVRLVVPVGKNILWLQLAYFPAYMVLFAFGCRAAASRLLDTLDWRRVKPWFWTAIVALPVLPLVIIINGRNGSFVGGWNLNAAIYAMWEPLVAWGTIGSLLYWFRHYIARPTALSFWLAHNAYATYIVHPPVLVALSVAARAWSIPPLAKFLVIGGLATAGSFIVAGLVRLIPGTRRVL